MSGFLKLALSLSLSNKMQYHHSLLRRGRKRNHVFFLVAILKHEVKQKDHEIPWEHIARHKKMARGEIRTIDM